ncbi:hypothetical protein T310_6034, partial [Rasamsonia emersonii CBS 393.64]
EKRVCRPAGPFTCNSSYLRLGKLLADVCCLVHGSEYFHRLPLDVQPVAIFRQIWTFHVCPRPRRFTFMIAITVTTAICPDRRSRQGDQCPFRTKP